MLGLKSLRDRGLARVARGRFSRTSLRAKHLTYEWQRQEDGPLERPPKWKTPAELEAEVAETLRKRQGEDYRKELFDLNPKPQTPPPRKDEVFGTDIPEPKVFGRVSIAEVYMNPWYKGKIKLMKLKTDFIQHILAERTVYDQDVLSALAEIEASITAHLKALGKDHFSELKEEENVALWSQSENRAALERLQRAISRTNYKNIPTLMYRLTYAIGYTSDTHSDVPVYEALHQALTKVIHILTPAELGVIYFALNHKFPKMGSLYFRRMIREQIEKLDFETLTLNEVLVLFFAFKTDVNHTDIQNRCTRYFISKFDGLSKLAGQRPTLPLEVLYTFANCRPPKRFLKRFKILSNEEREDIHLQDRMEHLYMPLVLRNLHLYREPQLLQLLSVLKVLSLRNYDEVFFAVQNYIAGAWDIMDTDVLGYLLYQTVKTNIRGFGSRAFWKDVAAKFFADAGKRDWKSHPSAFLRTVYALAHNKVLDPKQFVQKFGPQFIEAVQSPTTESGEFAFSALTVLYLDLADQAKDTVKDLSAAVLRAVVRKNQYIPLYSYSPLKYYLWYFSKRYPHWNFEPLESLSYHAEKSLSTSRLRSSLLTADHSELASVIKQQLNLDIIALVDFQNLFLIDFAQQDYRFAILVRGDYDVLYHEPGEPRLSTGLFELKAEILAQNKWTVCIIDKEEYKTLGANRAAWLKEQLEKSFKKSFERKPELAKEKVSAHFQREETLMMDMLNSDPTYDDHAEALQMIKKRREEEKAAAGMGKLPVTPSQAEAAPAAKQDKKKK